MHSIVRSWVTKSALALNLTTSLLTSSVALAELAPAPSSATGSAEAAPGEPSPLAKIAGLRSGAGARLAPAAAAKLEAMSDDALVALMEAPEGTAHSAEEQAIREAVGKEAFESQLSYEKGDIQIGDGLATLRLGEDFRYLDPKDAETLLVEGWGNPPGSRTLGMIVPVGVSPLDDTRGWAVVVSYTEEGYVEDDDAADIDYDDLLDDMKKDTLESNEQRAKEGYGALELVGWAAPPRYDAATHRLYWAKELKFEGSPENTVNYAIRVLGRKGVLELNAVGGMSQLAIVTREMEKVLPRAEFESGSRYADFNPSVDKVAAYGIGGLIAGKILAKAGIFAALVKLLIAGKKLVFIAVIAFGAGIAKLLRGRSAE